MDSGLEMRNEIRIQKLSKIWLLEFLSVDNVSDGGSRSILFESISKEASMKRST